MTTATIPARIVQFGVKMTAEWAERNPHMDSMPDGSSHWKCTLRCQRRRMTVYFSQGPAICAEPSAADVLNCLAMDAAGFENAQSFEDWCSEYGYDADSRKAERTYRAIEKQTERLRALIDPLGDAAWQNLLYHTESL